MRARRIFTIFIIGVLLTGMPSILAAAKSSNEIQEELNQYEDELSDSRAKSEELEKKIVDLQKEVGDMTSQVEALNIKMAGYRESMSARIKYFYETSGSGSLLDVLFGSESFSDFISKLDYIQSMYDYDARQLKEYDALIEEADEKQSQFNDQIDEMADLLKEQEELQDSLTDSISGKESEYAEAKEAEDAAAAAAKKAEEEARAAEQVEKDAESEKEQEEKELTEAAKTTVDEAKSSSDSSKSKSSDSSKKSSSGSGNVGKVSMYANDSGGVLTKSKGVVYYNGHKETWYSTKEGSAGVVTGIPGRYTGSDGIIRDGDGYICVASSDLPKGTLVETSLGMGKVYDTGCASGTIDIYTTW